MSMIHAIASGAVTRAIPLLRLCVLLGTVTVAGCGAAGLPSPSAVPAPTASGLETPSAAATPSAAGSPSGIGTETPGPAEQPGPPVATLVLAGGSPVEGALGSYVWDGAGSDAGWLVPPAAHGVRAHGPYAVVVAPPLPVDRWEAAWAPVEGDTAGDPAGSASGTGGPVSVPGPSAAGTWSLMVEVRFADGNHAAWYWRLEVLP